METKKKRWGDRRDATWLRDLDALHAFTPYMFPNRCDNEAYITQTIDLTNLNEYLAEKNRNSPDRPYTLFHAIAAALVKTITLRPNLNRFVQGRRMYQRDVLTLSFVVKKQFADDAHEALAFVEFPPDSTMDSVHSRIMDEIYSCRSEELDNSTAGMDALTKLPRPVLRFIMWLLTTMDFYGRVPNFLVKTDPNYATVFISNLGSIGLKAGYHHLTNWGTTSIFTVIGKKKPLPVYDENGDAQMHEGVDITFTLDERIADGYYYSRSMQLIRRLLQEPELLDQPADVPVDF